MMTQPDRDEGRQEKIGGDGGGGGGGGRGKHLFSAAAAMLSFEASDDAVRCGRVGWGTHEKPTPTLTIRYATLWYSTQARIA